MNISDQTRDAQNVRAVTKGSTVLKQDSMHTQLMMYIVASLSMKMTCITVQGNITKNNNHDYKQFRVFVDLLRHVKTMSLTSS